MMKWTKMESLERRTLIAETLFTVPLVVNQLAGPAAAQQADADLGDLREGGAMNRAGDDGGRGLDWQDLRLLGVATEMLPARGGEMLATAMRPVLDRLGAEARGTGDLDARTQPHTGMLPSGGAFSDGPIDFAPASRPTGSGGNVGMSDPLAEVTPAGTRGETGDSFAFAPIPGGDIGFYYNHARNIIPISPFGDLVLLGDITKTGEITGDDLAAKGPLLPGDDSLAAIVLPNVDSDNPGKAPDNWTGGSWGGTFYPANRTIDGGDDIYDIAPLHLQQFDLSDIPSNLHSNLVVQMSVSTPGGEHSFFNATSAQNRIRVFEPTAVSGNNHVLQVGDGAIIGPENGATQQFVFNPSSGQSDLNKLIGDGWVEFGVEGIEFGAMVDITITATSGATTVLAPDTVRFKVAPFIMADHTMPVASSSYLNGGQAIGVVNMNNPSFSAPGNQEMIQKMRDTWGVDNVNVGFHGDVWVQDGLEVGYVKAPYGEMPVIWELPRAATRQNQIGNWARNTFTAPGIGYATRISGAGNYAGTYDSGGNLETLPRTDGQPAYFFYGQSLSSPHTQWIAAQGVNEMLPVNTNWLAVGHVDEIVSPMSNGTHIAVADPAMAWAMVLWAAQVNPSAIMHERMNSAPSGYTVGSVANNTTLRNYNMNYVLAPSNLPSVVNTVVNALDLTRPVSTPVPLAGNGGNAQLSTGGAFTAFLSGEGSRFEVRFTSSSTYELYHRPLRGSADWVLAGTGSRFSDAVFPEARAYIMSNWWSGTPQVGDTFSFEGRTNATLVHLPVMYTGSTGSARAWSINHINSMIDAEGIVVGRSYGPLGSYLPGKPANASLFDDYVANAYQQALRSVSSNPAALSPNTLTAPNGANILFVDARSYHNGTGGVHCGQQALRVVPDYVWYA